MKFYLPLLFAALFLAAGCTPETCYEEKGLFTLEEYFERNPGLDLTQYEDTDMFYTIIEPGGAEKPQVGTSPQTSADIVVTYVGQHVTGEIFDQRPAGSPIEFNLFQLIPSWQLGLPLIGAGGRITLYVPSELAYGTRGSGTSICANSDLIFTLDLISFTQ